MNLEWWRNDTGGRSPKYLQKNQLQLQIPRGLACLWDDQPANNLKYRLNIITIDPITKLQLKVKTFRTL